MPIGYVVLRDALRQCLTVSLEINNEKSYIQNCHVGLTMKLI